MGSSKKHKKHKDRKHSIGSVGPAEDSNQSFTATTPATEQRPLKLVLKVSGGATGSGSGIGNMSPHMSPAVNFPEYEMQDTSRVTYESGFVRSGDEVRSSHSSEKKHKKKKSKKKHRKHSHHHHHHHHHRHRSSCSHHSKCSSSSPSAAIGSGGDGMNEPPILEASMMSPPQILSATAAPIPKLQISNANSVAPVISNEKPFELSVELSNTVKLENQDALPVLSGIPNTSSSYNTVSLASLICNQNLSTSVPTLGETLSQIQTNVTANGSFGDLNSSLSVPQSSFDSQPTVSGALPQTFTGLVNQTAPTLSQPVPVNTVSLSRAPIGLKPLSKSPLQSLLLHLVKQIEKRDPQEFFAWPVTDQIAPGYSSIIARPMDLSSIRQKISTNSYPSVTQLRSDVKLMCDNAMTYNRPDTIYYKAARKLWHYARDKLFTRDALLELVKLYQGVTNYQLGLTCADYSDADQAQFGNLTNVPGTMPVTNASVPTPSNGFASPPSIAATGIQICTNPALIDNTWSSQVRSPVEVSAEQILAEANKAARAAADRLSLQKPNGSHFALVRQQNDGSTSLAIVGSGGGSNNGQESQTELSLQSVVGKISDGQSSLPPFKESDLATARPVESVNTGCFSSYLPSVSSAKANLSQEESNMLLSTYGQSELGLAYSHSLLQFAGESDYVMNMVDSLLDVLTAGAHTKLLQKYKDEQANESAENMDMTTDMITTGFANRSHSSSFDVEMEELDKTISAENPDVNGRLAETSTLLSQLEQVQKQRLSSGPMPTKPCKEELRIAQLLSEKLAQLISTYTAPTDITDIKAIRKAMGVQPVKAELTTV